MKDKQLQTRKERARKNLEERKKDPNWVEKIKKKIKDLKK